jgi:hypothetical protein
MKRTIASSLSLGRARPISVGQRRSAIGRPPVGSLGADRRSGSRGACMTYEGSDTRRPFRLGPLRHDP